MQSQTQLAVAATLLFAGASTTANAAFIDDFDDTSNIESRDNRVDVTASGGLVSLTFNSNFPVDDAASAFTPIDYFVGAEGSSFNANQSGATVFDLATESQFDITGISLINPDGENDVLYAVRAFWFDGGGSIVNPAAVLRGNTQDTSDLSIDVATVAPPTATGYTIALALVKPGGGADGEVGDGVSFDTFSFTAIPEPSSLAAVGLLGLLAARRRR
ncbi:MAG: PEP-CTERM sorting domain-containing protein [Planctomycetota bacterium]